MRAQVVPGAKDTLLPSERKARLHPVTARMYEALEHKLISDASFSGHLDARTLAVAIHLASIGFATMAGELGGAKDAMKLPLQRYVDELAAAIGGGITRAGSSRRRATNSRAAAGLASFRGGALQAVRGAEPSQRPGSTD